MIGLGSNRLSVCRRGGMRVTQAGRGGMEWLAGGRLPSWANPYLPYSKAAGEALKAQFPTQWPTIAEYGFAHPALVPFINEDPMMVMSLIEGLGTRLQWSDGNCWILTNLNGTGDRIIELDLYVNNGTSGAFAFGSDAGVSVQSVLFGTGPSHIRYANENTSCTMSVGRHIVRMEKNKYYIDGSVYRTFNYATFNNGSKMAIFGSNRNNTISAGNVNFGFSHVKIEDENVYLVPIVGQNVQGMLDINDLENPVLYPKQGSGSFTISETPAS